MLTHVDFDRKNGFCEVGGSSYVLVTVHKEKGRIMGGVISELWLAGLVISFLSVREGDGCSIRT